MKPRAIDRLGVLVAGPRLTERSLEALREWARERGCAPAVLVDDWLEQAGRFGS